MSCILMIYGNPTSTCSAGLNRRSSVDRILFLTFLSCILHNLRIFTKPYPPPFRGRYYYYYYYYYSAYGRSKGSNPDRGKRLSFFRMSRPAPAPTQPPFGGDRASFPELKRQTHGFNHSPPSIAKAKNEWSYTSAPHIYLYRMDRVTLLLLLLLLLSSSCIVGNDVMFNLFVNLLVILCDRQIAQFVLSLHVPL